MELDATTIKNMACGPDSSLHFSSCNGLLGHWRMEGDLLDSSVNRWHGTAVAAPIFGNLFTSGRTLGSKALRLDGVNDYIQLPGRQFGGALTLCAHVRYDAFTSASMGVAKV